MSQSPTSTDSTTGEPDGSLAEVTPQPLGQPRLLRVTCPKDHILDAPCTLDGQDVVCPYCGTRFLFRYEDSEQYRHERVLFAENDESDRKPWADWFTLAAIAVIVGATLILRSGGVRWF